MSEDAVERAQARADRARDRLIDALATLKQRLLPATIARNLVQGAKDKSLYAAEAGVDAVKARPGLAVGAAALAAMFLARKPILRAISGANSDETNETPPPSPRSSRNAGKKVKP